MSEVFDLDELDEEPKPVKEGKTSKGGVNKNVAPPRPTEPPPAQAERVPRACDECCANCPNVGQDMTTLCSRFVPLAASDRPDKTQEGEGAMNLGLGQVLIKGLSECLDHEKGKIELKATEVEAPVYPKLPGMGYATVPGIKLPAEIAIAVDAINILNDKPTSVDFVASRIGVDPKSVYPVINTLRKAKIVASHKGPKGGTILVKSDVSIGELYTIFYKVEDVPQDVSIQKPSEHLSQHFMHFFNLLKAKIS